MSTHNRDYEREIEDFLANYEMALPSGEVVPGRDMFKRALSWDSPISIKEGINNPTLPDSWLGVVARVGQMLGKGELGVDAYDEQIEIIDSEQMLDAYSSVGLPNSFPTWMQGKQRDRENRNYSKGRTGLAYEIVINSVPAIAYCMEQNSKTMMILVILHACQGHGHFFKNNYLFKQFTDAENVLTDQRTRQAFVRECREKYGTEAVDRIIDACHAWRSHGVNRYTKPPQRSPEEEEARRMKILEAMERGYDHVMETTMPKNGSAGEFNKKAVSEGIELDKDENILRFVARYAPRLESWERQLIHHLCDIEQYFYPQSQTKVMNEGCATFVHYKLMERMMEMDLIDSGMWLEFVQSHTNVTLQVDFDDPRFNGINPYALGYAMCNDIVRVCQEPTEEDKKRFEYVDDFAGNPDWRGVWRSAMENYRDDSFIDQFLSPKLIRDFKLFSFCDDDQEEDIVIEAIHEEEGYDQVRGALADQYTLSNGIPNIEVAEWYLHQDRTLVLRHTMHNRQHLDRGSMDEVMKHLYELWEYPVILESVDENNKVVETFSCPTDAHRPPCPVFSPG